MEIQELTPALLPAKERVELPLLILLSQVKLVFATGQDACTYLFCCLTIPGIGFSYRRFGANFKYAANNSAIFIPESLVSAPDAYTLADLECASGTTSSSPAQLLFITPIQYQEQLNSALVYEPGHWKLQTEGGLHFTLQSFTGGVFTCRMPNENGVVVDTSVGIFPNNYDKNSKLITCCLQWSFQFIDCRFVCITEL